MIRTDLSDFTFIVPVRIDSPERKENLELVITYLYEHFDAEIMVLEADIKEKITIPQISHKIFIKDDDPVFHHSYYRNYMIKSANTRFIALWDADAIAPENQVIEARNMLRETNCDLIFPYDGRYYHTPPHLRKLYTQEKHTKVLCDNIGKLPLMHGIHSVGGAIMMNREKYIDAGMENEKFYGWSPEDYERVLRCEILGYKIMRINGPLFHLDHPRGKTSKFYSNYINISSRKELFKICGMTPLELKSYIDSEEWLANKYIK